MSDERKAVFLSYASQDAEAARRICDALRGAGVEVWFDQSELRGGDAWDAKIRKQIKECALFVPVISANTQARAEGYFRREWKLAVDRTHDMADHVPFLVPIVIDGTKDADAFVPEKFREVQWTRLPDGGATPAFCGRVKALLDDGDAIVTSPARSSGASDSVELAAHRHHHASQSPHNPWRMLVLAVAGLIIAGAAFWFWQSRPPGSAPLSGMVAQPPSDAERLAAQAMEIAERLGHTRDDLTAAELLAKQATDLEPNSPRMWGVRAWINAMYLVRSWDSTVQRRQDVELFARRALATDPNEPDAITASAEVLYSQEAYAQAEAMARQADRIRPNYWRTLSVLANALGAQGKLDEQREIYQGILRRDPTKVLAHYGLAQWYVAKGRPTVLDVDKALATLDEGIAKTPFASGMALKAFYLVAWRGDLVGMRAMLNELGKLPALVQADDAPLYIAMWGSLLERKPELTLAAAKLTSRGYFEHTSLASPKAWFTAMAHTLAGQNELARAEWRVAEAVLRERLRQRPDAQVEQLQLAATLVWLGRTTEAQQLVESLAPLVLESRGVQLNHMLACYYAALDDARAAAPCLRIALNQKTRLTDYTLPLDPWWDRLRGKPEFETLLAEATARRADDARQRAAARMPAQPAQPNLAAVAAATADPKSIAVLPFANLSTEKENEFFADGVQDDVITNLAKIRDLTVISRTSTLAYRDTAARNLKKIAADLGVATILEGSVRRVGNKVHMNAQLIDARTDAHLWADTFDGDASDPFALQASVARKIAAALKATLTPGERTLLNRRPTENVTAYELFLQAKLLSASLYSPSLDAEWDRVFGLLEKSIAADPKFAQAQALLARTHSALYFYRRQTKPEERERARVCLEAARRLAPDAPETRTAEGYFAYACLQDYPTAAHHLELAVAELPNDARTWYYLGLTKRRLGRSVEAVAAMERAVQLDPRDSALVSNLMLSLVQLRRFSRVVALDRQVRDDTSPVSLGVYAVILARYEIDGNRDALIGSCRAWVPPATSLREERPDVIAALLSGGLETAALAAEKIEGPWRSHQQALFAHLLGRTEDARRYARLAEEKAEAENAALDWPHSGEAKAIELLMYSGRTAEALARARALQPKLHGFDDILETATRNKLGRVFCLAGARDEALMILRQLMTGLGTFEATPRMVRLDPCWSKLADDPRFDEILREARPL